MSIFAIADLHLSFNNPKPMNIFGKNWNNHEEKIKNDWKEKVKENDIVLLPGDFSWSMTIEQVYKDFKFIEELPGRKIILKGNHDYWWNTITSMNNYLKQNNLNTMDFLYNNSFLCENKIIAGTKGWILTDIEENGKMINREIIRLELSIKDGIQKYGNDKEIIVCMHYPPITNSIILANEKQQFIELMKKYNVKMCIYGHLHANSHKDAVEGNIKGIELRLVSADYLDFKLMQI